MESRTSRRHSRPLSEAAIQLKALRLRTGMSLGELAERLRRPKSTYAGYENRYYKPFLPQWLVNALVPIFERSGITAAETLALGGLVPADLPKPEAATTVGYALGGPPRSRPRTPFLDRSVLRECLKLYLEGLERTPKAKGWTPDQKAKGFLIVYERFLGGRPINESAMREEIEMLP